PCARPAEKTASVDGYFVHLYYTAAETMTSADAPKDLLSMSDAALRQDLLDKLVDSHLTGPCLQLRNVEPSELPTKELPHGNFSTLFLLYRAFAQTSGEMAASRATFYKACKRWRPCLRFHKQSNHSKCLTCVRLQSRIESCSDFLTHAKLSDELLGHFVRQYRDRHIYYLARARARTQKDLLTLIIDSYDKAKCSLPKWCKSRAPKKSIYEATKRTAITLTCAICHGWGIYFYLSDEGLPGGSNWTLEVVPCSKNLCWKAT
ncbi:unnamed protein product, partial [Durusdinium trenchii]